MWSTGPSGTNAVRRFAANAGLVSPVPETSRSETRDRVADDRRQLVLELRGVGPNGGELFSRQAVGDRQLLIDHWTAMRVARVEQYVRAAEPMTTLNERDDAIRHPGRDTQEIGGDEDGGGLIAALECERFRMQRHRDALRRLRASGEPGHPQRSIGSDVDRGHPGTPRRRRSRHAPRGQADRGNGGEEVTAVHGREGWHEGM